MSRKLEPDIRAMSSSERGKALEKLRALLRAMITKRGNNACWMRTLEAACQLPEYAGAPLTHISETEWMSRCGNFWEAHPGLTSGIPVATLLRNCRAYYHRQPGGMGPAIPAIPCPYASKCS